ncbi:hypothetical protein [Limosilactobacillus reuteri]|uniref:hypothetical protein n=1 Tax=Limosilactobacillus reuteri TaxID=1598 RepID=UPI001E3BB068|nr:hypothetical protein [Limosilactobacillus reuteri]UFK69171.1 hypothetical protein IVR12_02282 [Limosilactobacillus reuteri]
MKDTNYIKKSLENREIQKLTEDEMKAFIGGTTYHINYDGYAPSRNPWAWLTHWGHKH